MAKLLKLTAGQKITIAANAAAGILRDVAINDVSLRRLVYTDCDPSSPDGKAALANTVEFGTHNAVEVYTADAAIDAEATKVVDLTVATNGTGYKVSHASMGDGSAGAMAASAYGDPNRTTFASLQDFVRLLAQNGAFKEDLETATGIAAIDGLLIDQVEERVAVLASDATDQPSLTFVCGVQFDDAISSQYGE